MKKNIIKTTEGTLAIGDLVLTPGSNEVDAKIWEELASLRPIRSKLKFGILVVENRTPIEIVTKPQEAPGEPITEEATDDKGAEENGQDATEEALSARDSKKGSRKKARKSKKSKKEEEPSTLGELQAKLDRE